MNDAVHSFCFPGFDTLEAVKGTAPKSVYSITTSHECHGGIRRIPIPILKIKSERGYITTSILFLSCSREDHTLQITLCLLTLFYLRRSLIMMLWVKREWSSVYNALHAVVLSNKRMVGGASFTFVFDILALNDQNRREVN